MATTVFTSKGVPIQLGKELGRGGEGSVYELASSASQVAKLYHQPPITSKQAKLAFMAATADPELLRYAAWPQETLHPSRGGPVVGFLMEKVVAREPIHMVYSPAHRRQQLPRLAWDYLLFVARNTATAFETLHARGHVLGDVNQGNVLAGVDSKVVLIDCDSFQVNARGTQHLCEVGVAHFTPPELQGLPSFHGVVRTPNHDNFALALLIFHLMFGGRHPYSGVPLRSGVGDSLETDIKALRYAYARDGHVRGLKPPPRSIPLSVVPDGMEQMFQVAFTEAGTRGARPTADQWVQALDGLRGRLKRCGASPMHVYPDHLTRCPWCALEQEGVVYFVDLGTVYTPTASGFVLARVWALVEAVPVPSVVALPDVERIVVKAEPVPPHVSARRMKAFLRVLTLCAAALFCARTPETAWPFGILGAAFVVWLIGLVEPGPLAEERAKRRRAKEAAQREYDRLVEQLQREAGPQGFSARRQELVQHRDEYEELSHGERRELDRLQSTAQERQKQKFLDGCFIESADIVGVGPARKAALRSFGIETAADVDGRKVRQIRGFGDGLTSAVVAWKLDCERRFLFNPKTAVSETDRNVVRARFGARRRTLEALLNGGAEELRRFGQTAVMRANTLQPLLLRAAENLAQATADLKAM